MSEAIWLAGSALPKSSRETPQNWVERFLAESRVKADWITSIHVIEPKLKLPAETWEFPLLPLNWQGEAGQAHFILGAVCREVRSGVQDLVLLLEEDSAGWNASLLASPAFFGPRNRIPEVALLETRVFDQADPVRRKSLLQNHLEQFNLQAGDLPDATAAWMKNAAWLKDSGVLGALNAASGHLAGQPSRKSALLTAEISEPATITILEGL